MPDFRDVSFLLDPKSIAIVGASPKETGWPARIWGNLRQFGYPGKIYLVNPRYETIWEERCYRSVDDLPEVVDHALMIVPAERAVEVFRGSKKKKFRAATILSAGFGEGNDPEGLKRGRFLQAYAREEGIPLCGPNCMGLVSTKSRAILFPDQRLGAITEGGLAIVSQSGGLGGTLVRTVIARGLGISYLVSSGNEADAELSDYLHYFMNDPHTKVVAAIIEGVREAEKFLAVAKEALCQAKPILTVKIGRSSKGKEAALSHTGALAGNDRVFDALCLQNGLIRARDFDELINTAELFLATPALPQGKRVAFLTISGGLRGLLSDMSEEVGLGLPELHADTKTALEGLLEATATIGNPLDVGWGGLSSQEAYLKCVRAMLDDPEVDMLAIQEEWPRSEIRPDKENNLLAVSKIAADCSKPVTIFSVASQGVNDYGRQFKRRCSLPFLEEAYNTVLALKHLGHFAEAVRRFPQKEKISPLLSRLGPKEKEALRPTRVLNERLAYPILQAYGVPMARAAFAQDCSAALGEAEKIGYPVVLKLVAHGMAHKTELKGVRVNLKNPEELGVACKEMEASFKSARSAKDFGGFLVQEMVSGGIETIIGTLNDPQFGPIVMFGLGGTSVEVYRDVVFRTAPVDREEATEMIRSTRGFPLLSGFRGKPPADLDTLCGVIARVSELAAAERDLIESIDINPFIILEHGGKAADALITTSRPAKDHQRSVP